MLFHKIRVIVKNTRKYPNVYGVTIPEHFKDWFNRSVNISESGNCLLLESGAKPEPLSLSELKDCSEKIEVIRF